MVLNQSTTQLEKNTYSTPSDKTLHVTVGLTVCKFEPSPSHANESGGKCMPAALS